MISINKVGEICTPYFHEARLKEHLIHGRNGKMSVTGHGIIKQNFVTSLNSSVKICQGGTVVAAKYARWDTGSEYTYIDTPLSQNLEKIEGQKFTAKGIGASQEGNSYLVDLAFANGIIIKDVEVGALDLSSLTECQVIIGLDVIRQGKLTVDGKTGTFLFEI